MRTTQRIEIDLAVRGVTETVQAVQGDMNSRVLEITLVDGGAVVDTTGCTGIVRYRRADGTGGNYDTAPDGTSAVSFDGNIATVQIAPDVLAAPGVAQVAVAIVAGTSMIHTFVFQIDVQKNPGMNVTASGGFYLAGTLPDSGWEPEMYLGTDKDGKVVAKAVIAGNVTQEQIQAAVDSYLDKNPVEPGATAEQAAQIQANAEAIADIRDPVVSGNTHWEENAAIITMALASGGSDVIKAEFDDNANLTKITVNGREIPWTTTGV